MASLRFATFNINGCRDAVNRFSLFNYIMIMRTSIVPFRGNETLHCWWHWGIPSASALLKHVCNLVQTWLVQRQPVKWVECGSYIGAGITPVVSFLIFSKRSLSVRVLFGVVCPVGKHQKWRVNSNILRSVFTPVLVLFRMGMHAVFVWAVWEWSMFSQPSRGLIASVASVYHWEHCSRLAVFDQSVQLHAMLVPQLLRQPSGFTCVDQRWS